MRAGAGGGDLREAQDAARRRRRGALEDGEVSVKFNENIRGQRRVIVQATGAPADNLMELLVMPRTRPSAPRRAA